MLELLTKYLAILLLFKSYFLCVLEFGSFLFDLNHSIHILYFDRKSHLIAIFLIISSFLHSITSILSLCPTPALFLIFKHTSSS